MFECFVFRTMYVVNLLDTFLRFIVAKLKNYFKKHYYLRISYDGKSLIFPA